MRCCVGVDLRSSLLGLRLLAASPWVRGEWRVTFAGVCS